MSVSVHIWLRVVALGPLGPTGSRASSYACIHQVTSCRNWDLGFSLPALSGHLGTLDCGLRGSQLPSPHTGHSPGQPEHLLGRKGRKLAQEHSAHVLPPVSLCQPPPIPLSTYHDLWEEVSCLLRLLASAPHRSSSPCAASSLPKLLSCPPDQRILGRRCLTRPGYKYPGSGLHPPCPSWSHSSSLTPSSTGFHSLIVHLPGPSG